MSEERARRRLPGMGDLSQIGHVAEETGLSLRTIRYYEEVGLVVPAERSTGGFRMYSAGDIRRLQLIMLMKPLDISLADMAVLIEAIENPNRSRRALQDSHALLTQRCEKLRRQLDAAESLVETISEAVAADI